MRALKFPAGIHLVDKKVTSRWWVEEWDWGEEREGLYTLDLHGYSGSYANSSDSSEYWSGSLFYYKSNYKSQTPTQFNPIKSVRETLFSNRKLLPFIHENFPNKSSLL